MTNPTFVAGANELAWHGAVAALGDAWRDDPALRARAEEDPLGVLAEYGVEIPEGADARIVANTDDTVHLCVPPDPNERLEDESLVGVSGGSCASTAATLGSVSTIPSCGGCVGAWSSAGSA